MKQLFILASVLLLQSHIFSQSTYYIQNSSGITRVDNKDPDEVSAKEWRVYLYKKNAAINGSAYWGTIKGNSAAEVMVTLKTNQNFELQFNAFMGKGRVQDDIYTHFNPKGPVAVMDDVKDYAKEDAANEGFTNMYDKAKQYLAAYKEVKNKLDVILKGKPSTAFDNVGRVFREYAGNLKTAIGQILVLKKMINSTQLMDDMTQAMANIDHKLTDVSNQAANLNKRIDNNIADEGGGDANGEYAYFTLVTSVPTNDLYPSGVRVNKSVYFVSGPVRYDVPGAFNDDEWLQFNEFLALVRKSTSDYTIDYTRVEVAKFSETRGSNLAACRNGIAGYKQGVINGVGGDMRWTQIVDVNIKGLGGGHKDNINQSNSISVTQANSTNRTQNNNRPITRPVALGDQVLGTHTAAAANDAPENYKDISGDAEVTKNSNKTAGVSANFSVQVSETTTIKGSFTADNCDIASAGTMRVYPASGTITVEHSDDASTNRTFTITKIRIDFVKREITIAETNPREMRFSWIKWGK